MHGLQRNRRRDLHRRGDQEAECPRAELGDAHARAGLGDRHGIPCVSHLETERRWVILFETLAQGAPGLHPGAVARIVADGSRTKSPIAIGKIGVGEGTRTPGPQDHNLVL